MPGYKRGSYWVGQLWLGVKRLESPQEGWSWDSPLFPPFPLPFSSWVPGATTKGNVGKGIDCAIMRVSVVIIKEII